MRYTATSHAYDDNYSITDLILTDCKLSFDWTEDGRDGHLEAFTDDGVTFSGIYGYPLLEDWRRASFRLYRSADNGAALVGIWSETGGNEGGWLLVLAPVLQTEH